MIWRVLFCGTWLVPVLVAAQQPVPGAPRRPGDTTAVRRDSLSDTTRKRVELVKWPEPDSVVASLLARQGYTSTRYRGDRVTFDAERRILEVSGGAAVQREQMILVSDSIVYNDSVKIVRAMGDTIVLRNPSESDADLVALGRLSYDLRTRRGVGTNISTAFSQDQTWFVSGEHTGFISDSTRSELRTYAVDGRITSCDLIEPHYHFQAGEMKVIAKRIMVARPAVLYIADIPVLWLPFVFQDMRSGRRSGMLAPRIGITDIVRTSPSYRRQIENLGYYFALSEYMDALVSFDWRSGARGSDIDPGWTRWNGEWRYKWLDRFLGGRVAVSHSSFDDGPKNTAVTWDHSQEFSQRSRLNANLNFATSPRLQRTQAFTVAQALATIYSSLSFSQGIGPASVSIGGNRRQFVGRSQVDQTFPELNITTKPMSLGEWLVWTPGLSVSNRQLFNGDQGGFGSFRYSLNPNTGRLDSALIRRNERTTGLSFQTPLRILGFDWSNALAVSDVELDYPQSRVILGVNDTTQRATRVFERTFLTSVDWQTGISLPPLLQGRWNLVPSVRIVNSDASAAFTIRSERTGGRFVSQSKRLEYGLAASPTFFGLFPGFGPFSRLRHSISPSVSYAFAPRGNVSDAFLEAQNRTRQGYLGAQVQNQITLSLSQIIEAKFRGANADSSPESARKVKLLSVDFTPIAYDFERARITRRTGFTSQTFGYNLRSELLPGFDVSVGYSLFQGNVLSDSARFKPYRETVSASLALGRDRNPFAALTRFFGGAVPPQIQTSSAPYASGEGTRLQSPAIAGAVGSRYPLGIESSQGWAATLSYVSSRRRPPVGENVTIFDPTAFCRQQFGNDPITRRQCEEQTLARVDTIPTTTQGGRYIQLPATSTLKGNFTFNLTPRWAAQWGTGYDFERSEFSDHIVTLQRDLHDWRAIFSFTQAPNGNFSFNFFISLKAQPDLKFDYNRRTYRPGSR